MRFIRRKGTRSVVTLFVVGALALAMTGVLYAHWTDQLDATIGIQTGTLDLTWGEAGTDDDGIVDNDDGFTPDDDGPVQIYDAWGASSSADPALPYAEERYDKDVGLCFAGVDLETLYVQALNAYPSYHCGFYTSIENLETIPVKAGYFELVVEAEGAEVDAARVRYGPDGMVELLTEDLLAVEVTLDLDGAIECGAQVDPGDILPVTGWFHVEQDAQQGANYGFYIHQEFVNWNEWTPDMCIVNGVVGP